MTGNGGAELSALRVWVRGGGGWRVGPTRAKVTLPVLEAG
jgi:hypothetical protein